MKIESQKAVAAPAASHASTTTFESATASVEAIADTVVRNKPPPPMAIETSSHTITAARALI